MKTLVKSILAVGLIGASTFAAAAPISGVSFSSTDASLFNWDYNNDLLSFSANNASVDSLSGLFSGYLNIGDSAHFNNFYYNSNFTTTVLWESNGIFFTAETLDVADEIKLPGKSTPFAGVFGGYGYLTAGEEKVYGNWNVSVNTGGNTFSWSSSTEVEAAEVPEPATLGLLALAGLGLAARRKFTA